MHHTVLPGDTLYDIGTEYGVDRNELYRRNMGTIEAAAKSHGYESSNGGTLLFAGITLNVSRQAWVL